MGADGGTKLQRKDLIQQKKTSKFDEANAQAYNRIGKWTSCNITNKPLDIPIVSDYKGKLYNKESVLEYLLDPEAFSENQQSLLSHINSMKDVIELKITKDESANELTCSITGNILGSNGIPYIYLVKCRDTFAKKCLKEINKDTKNCPVCNEPYENEDIITINPEAKEDIDFLEKRIKDLESSNLSHSLRKVKKQKKRKDQEKDQDSSSRANIKKIKV